MSNQVVGVSEWPCVGPAKGRTSKAILAVVQTYRDGVTRVLCAELSDGQCLLNGFNSVKCPYVAPAMNTLADASDFPKAPPETQPIVL